jgi:hypothetical protein
MSQISKCTQRSTPKESKSQVRQLHTYIARSRRGNLQTNAAEIYPNGAKYDDRKITRSSFPYSLEKHRSFMFLKRGMILLCKLYGANAVYINSTQPRLDH